MDKVFVATRASQLSLTQTGQLVDRLKEKNSHVSFEIITFKTTGDNVTDRPLSSFRGIGVFVKELQTALLEKRADMAVHSLKDVPTERPDELILAAYPERINPFDVLLTKENLTFEELESGSVVGTSSSRRMVQLKAARRDLKFKDLRGNLDTRIRKLEDGQYDAIIVAAAGMKRLGKEFNKKSLLPNELCLPAVGQGALVIECRKNDELSTIIANSVNDDKTKIEIEAERSFLIGVGGGCSMPIAAHAVVMDEMVTIDGMVGDPDTADIVRSQCNVTIDDHIAGGQDLAKQVLSVCTKKGIHIF